VWLGNDRLTAGILLLLYYSATQRSLDRALDRHRVRDECASSHYYQRAPDGGLTVDQTVRWVFGMTVVLAGLAIITFSNLSSVLQLAKLIVDRVLIGTKLCSFGPARLTR
jgi:hypothetical protein